MATMTTMTEPTPLPAEPTDLGAAPPPAMMMIGTWLQHAMLALGLDVGHRAGLLELAASTGPATSEQLAAAGGLSERHVREWLGLMTVGGLFTYDPATRQYTLPADHAMFVTGPGMNLAAFAGEVSYNAGYVPRVAETIRVGGGISYEEQPEFTERMAEMSGRAYSEESVGGYLGVVPGLIERLEQGARVADIGCGSGRWLSVLASLYPASTFVGFDFSPDALAAAREAVGERGLTNVVFEQSDVAELPQDVTFDIVFAVDSIHDQARPRRVLAEVRRVLDASGSFVMIDPALSSNLEDNVANPMAPWIYGASLFHCMQVSLAQGGEGLGTAYGEQTARALLTEAGFSRVELLQPAAPDPFNGIFHCQP